MNKPLFLAVFLAAVAAQASLAQATPRPGTTFGDWIVECERPAAGAADKCFVSQYVSSTKPNETAQQMLKLSIGHLGPNDAAMAVAVLPLGISIPAGAAFRIDQHPAQPLILQECTQQGCMASADISADTVGAMADGEAMAVGIVVAGASETTAIPVSLKGFKDAFAALD